MEDNINAGLVMSWVTAFSGIFFRNTSYLQGDVGNGMGIILEDLEGLICSDDGQNSGKNARNNPLEVKPESPRD